LEIIGNLLWVELWYSTNKVDLATDKVNNNENAAHLKLKLRKSFSDRLKVSFGADYFVTQFKEDFKENSGSFYQWIRF
jgi:hypothetical protein